MNEWMNEKKIRKKKGKTKKKKLNETWCVIRRKEIKCPAHQIACAYWEIPGNNIANCKPFVFFGDLKCKNFVCAGEDKKKQKW